MAYTAKTWADGVAGNTPITAADLNHLETQYSEAIATVQTMLTKSAVGLGNVDNTSDADKPISTATQTALDAKVSVTNAGLGTVYIRNAAGSPTSLPYINGSAAASSIAMRDSAGAIHTATPTATTHAATKAYVDAADALAVPASVAGTTTVFNKNAAGVLGGLAYAYAATANTLAIRNTNGVLEVGTPTATTHATTKAYVDSAVASGGGTTVDQTARDSAAAAQSTANSKYLLPSTGMPSTDMAAAVQTALTKANNSVQQTDVYVWSQPNTAAGGGPGGITIDATAAPNVARNTTARASESYIAMGREALGAATRARSCIAIGSLALGRGNPGFGNLAIGTFALSNVQGISEFAADMPGSRNIGIGSLSGYFVSSGYRNTFLGRDSGQTVTSGYYNTGIGYRAVSGGIAPVGLDGTITNQYATTNTQNTAVGDSSLTLIANDGNTAVGAYSGDKVRVSIGNVFVGAQAATTLGQNVSENNKSLTRPNITGTYSQSGTTITVTATSHGAVAGNKVSITFTSGTINTSYTSEAQWVNVASVTSANVFTITSPVSLTTSGNCTLNIVETATTEAVGGYNTIVGYQAMDSALNTGGNNTVIGEQANKYSTGAQNTSVGSRAGFNMTTGAQNTFVGYNAGRALTTGGGLTTQSNVTVLGQGAGVSGDNQVQLGNSTTTTYVYGTVQNRSDARDKADVRDTELGLEFVEKLRPVDYRWDMREDYLEYDEDGNVTELEKDGSKKRKRYHHGLIAQEVAELDADFGGLQDHSLSDSGADVMSIGYDELIAPLIKSVQELSAQNRALQKRIEELEAK